MNAIGTSEYYESRISEWCIKQHQKTNHFYDTYLPYEFHLRMVYNVFLQFSYLLDNNKELKLICEIACWGHDLIEDCRVTYNDCRSKFGKPAADIIYAVTNEKGKNRQERANEKFYEELVKVEGAVFVKLCDRIANVQYSKMLRSRMYDKYKEENVYFMEKLGGANPNHEYFIMFQYLMNLFQT